MDGSLKSCLQSFSLRLLLPRDRQPAPCQCLRCCAGHRPHPEILRFCYKHAGIYVGRG
jgi:hypothetical protein